MVSKKEEKFIEKFIKLYFKRREFDIVFEKDKKDKESKDKIKKLDKEISKLLPNYPILFDNDLVALYGVFNKIAKDEKATFLVNNFKSFLEWTLDRLHKEKIIDKKTYEILNQHVARLNFNLKLPGSILWKG